MRQRTKIGTRFGVRHQHAAGETFAEHTTFEAEVDALTTEKEAERRARVQLARCRKQKRGCKFVRAVSYRLAPLVELPAWKQQGADDYVVHDNGNPSGPFVRYARFDSMWVTTIGWMNGERFPTADEARAACEARLRELGYKVAKAKKGGAS